MRFAVLLVLFFFLGLSFGALHDISKGIEEIAFHLSEIRISIDSQTDVVDAIPDEVMDELGERLPNWVWNK